MAENPGNLVRVSNDHGHFTVSAATAERAGSRWRVLKQDAVYARTGLPLPSKPREDVAEPSPARARAAKKAAARRTTSSVSDTDAATPTPTEPETVSGDTPKE
jgi:hypothetical protein